MLLNGIAHDEAPGTAGYTTAGDEAGNNGNVAVSSNANASRSQPHRPLDVRPVPRHRHPALLADPDRIRPVLEPAEPDREGVELRGHARCRPRQQLGCTEARGTGRLPRQRLDDQPHSLRRRVARPANVLQLGRPVRRAAAHRAHALSGQRRERHAERPERTDPDLRTPQGNTNGTASAILDSDNAVVVIPAGPAGRRHLQRHRRVERRQRSLDVQRRPERTARCQLGATRPSRPAGDHCRHSPQATRSSPSRPSASPTPGFRGS